ncbi:MAG: glyoxalase/bleomycin resistance/dioxygenase family protein [Eubacteriales bacterium]|nr:glyoxalase/bleomycin resistance/dioxygenase family protein [Eubacteriales bacterium]
MRYQCALIAVKDVHKSLAFYQAWFDMEVEVDLGANIALKGGLTLQENFAGLVGFPEDTIKEQAHNGELYFETDTLDELDRRLHADPSIRWVHPIKEYPWLQRVLRIYDPDGHIIEVGESMGSIFRRLQKQGHTIEEISQATQHPASYVRDTLEGR